MKYFLIFISFWIEYCFSEGLNYQKFPEEVKKTVNEYLLCKDLRSLGQTNKENARALSQEKRYQLSKDIIGLFKNIVSQTSENVPSFVRTDIQVFALVKENEPLQMIEIDPKNFRNDVSEGKIFVRYSITKHFFRNLGRKGKRGSREVTYQKDLKVWWDEGKRD